MPKLLIDRPLRYLTRAFAERHSRDLLPGARLLGKLVGALELEEDPQPVTVMRMSTSTGDAVNAVALVARNSGWHITFAPDSVDIEHYGADTDGRQFVAHDVFLARAQNLYGYLAADGKTKFHRLASVVEGLLPELGDEKTTSIGALLLRYPPTFKAPPYEWDWRGGWRDDALIGGVREELNTIVTARRLRSIAILDGPPSDRIRLDIDINTAPSNTEARFGQNAIGQFFADATRRYAQLSEDMAQYLGEGR